MLSKRERYALLLAQHLSPTARRGHEALSTAQLVAVANSLVLGDATPLNLSTAVVLDVREKLQTARTLGGVVGGVRCWNIVWPEAHRLVTDIIQDTTAAPAGAELLEEFEKEMVELMEPLSCEGDPSGVQTRCAAVPRSPRGSGSV